MMTYDLYHVVRATPAEALAEYHAVSHAVHHLGGALWTSLADGAGSQYVVIALPTGTSLDALAGLEPVALLKQSDFEDIDPDFMPLEEPQEEPTDDQPEAGAR